MSTLTLRTATTSDPLQQQIDERAAAINSYSISPTLTTRTLTSPITEQQAISQTIRTMDPIATTSRTAPTSVVAPTTTEPVEIRSAPMTTPMTTLSPFVSATPQIQAAVMPAPQESNLFTLFAAASQEPAPLPPPPAPTTTVPSGTWATVGPAGSQMPAYTNEVNEFSAMCMQYGGRMCGIDCCLPNGQQINPQGQLVAASSSLLSGNTGLFVIGGLALAAFLLLK